jgi:regulator of nucleoside diphosphate kinase
MTVQLPIVLTSADFTVLQNLAGNWREPFAGASQMIRRKLDAATIMFPADIPADVVTLGSRVRFRVGSEPARECSLARELNGDGTGDDVALASALGLAMIGAAAGDVVQLPKADGTVEQVLIEAVLFQPEQKRAGPALRVVSRAQPPLGPNVFALREPQAASFSGEWDDDPGPSAA